MSDENEIDLDELRIDLSDAEESKFEPLPAGSYNAEITGATVKLGKESNQPYVNWEWTIEGTERKAWSITSLDFNNSEIDKRGKRKGPGIRDNFFTFLTTLGVFTEEELRGNALNVQDIITQAVGASATLVLTVDAVYDNNKVKSVKKLVTSNSLMPND